MKYLRDAWYVAGLADELQPGQLLARTLLEEPVVFFRRVDGTLAALFDRCPHRFAPLSQGKLCDGAVLQCAYHGLRFNDQGACVHNPHGDGSIPKAASVKAYAVCERDGLLWWWAGDVEKADKSLIPDYSQVASATADATIKGYMPTQCHYQLLVDNILDLTHVDFLHAGFLGSGAITRTKPEVTEIPERSVKVSWQSSGDLAPHAFDMYLREQGRPTDQWTEVTWTAPSNMLLAAGATLLGETREQGSDSLNLHLTTPESDDRCHYWYWTTRTFAINAEANAEIAKFVQHTFVQQDKPMLEAQQSRIGGAGFWSLKPLLLHGDAAAVRVRRKLDALIAAESEE